MATQPEFTVGSPGNHIVEWANHWSKECQYISDITEVALRRRAPDPDKCLTMSLFNYDTECLKRYLVMQRESARRGGFFDAETYIQHCIDDLTSA